MVKVLAAPINPSDIAFMKGTYENCEMMCLKYPIVAGWEGSGIVVQNGGGIRGWWALGKRVAFVVNPKDSNFCKTGGCYQ